MLIIRITASAETPKMVTTLVVSVWNNSDEMLHIRNVIHMVCGAAEDS